MGNTERTIRNYLDEKGLQKDLSGYYFLESAISYAIANPYMKCQGIFENMLAESKIECAPATAYSASIYALKKAKTKISVKRFIRLAADEISRDTTNDGKEGSTLCH